MIKNFIKDSILDLLKNSSSDKKIKKLIKTHKQKIHFIPIRYRIFGGLLQSMNIQFGNFIENLLHKIIESQKHLQVLEYSGSRNVKLKITKKSDEMIDNYITIAQIKTFNDNELLENFENLLKECLKIEKETKNKEIQIKHDIDVLFKDEKGIIYYLEVKYNDDHDTGKYIDINRKLIKSYIGISNLIQVYDLEKFKPILYYLTQKRLKGNIYLPESKYIYRGDKLFKQFFELSYQELDKIMSNIGDDKEILELFDSLYDEIRYKRIINV